MSSKPVNRRSVIIIIVLDLVAFGIGVPLLVAGVLETGHDAQPMAASGATLCTLGLLLHRWRPLLKEVAAPDNSGAGGGSKGVALVIGLFLILGLLGRVNAETKRHGNWLNGIEDRLQDVEGQVSNLEYERYR